MKTKRTERRVPVVLWPFERGFFILKHKFVCRRLTEAISLGCASLEAGTSPHTQRWPVLNLVFLPGGERSHVAASIADVLAPVQHAFVPY